MAHLDRSVVGINAQMRAMSEAFAHVAIQVEDRLTPAMRALASVLAAGPPPLSEEQQVAIIEAAQDGAGKRNDRTLPVRDTPKSPHWDPWARFAVLDLG